MARAWRIEYEGALYHVLSRGNERRDIVFDNKDRQLFLDLLGQALAHQTAAGDTVQTTSSDGSLTVRLQPTDDDALATIRTSAGLLTGRDHWITVETMETAP